MISSGINHELINRFSGNYTTLDIVEGTFKMYKIEIRKILSPMKLFINYRRNYDQKKNSGGSVRKDERDLRIIYSQTNSKPDEKNCDGIAENVACLTLNSTGVERYFNKEFVYLKFESICGQRANLKLEFPR